MAFADFMHAFPALGLPFPPEQVDARAIRSEAGLVIFFHFHKDMEIPLHAHGAQWGTVVAGEILLTIGAETRVCRPGHSYAIPAGTLHGARISAGTEVIDVFEEADRYAFRG